MCSKDHACPFSYLTLLTELISACAANSRLQASAVAFGESLAIPEIVAIGGQVILQSFHHGVKAFCAGCPEYSSC